MSGAPPYSLRSPPPAQQTNYNSYSSSPSKSRSYYPNSDQYQQQQHPPPETPQPYGSSYSRSPHFVHANSPLSNTLPPLNGTPHSDASPPYPSHAGASYSLPRIHPSHGMPDTHPAPPYGQSHSHPPSRHEGHLLSPKKEPGTSFISARENGYAAHSPVMRPPSPKESVSLILSQPCRVFF
jgi:chromatin-remodeling ATPase INO80